MAIVQTRYRDVPWEEIAAAHQGCVMVEDPTTVWAGLRGRALQIETPAIEGTISPGCDGPFYRIWPYEFKGHHRLCVCPHIAEIGD